MKRQSFHVFFNFLLFCALLLLSSHSISARPIYQAEKEVKPDGIAHVTFFKEDLVKLTGSSGECDDDENDEECVKRRMIAEAHLDYIYTQRNNHP